MPIPLDLLEDGEVAEELMTRAGLFRAQKSVLEDLFGQDWFESAPKARAKHPAFQRWMLCRDLLGRDGKLRMPDDERQLSEIAQVVLDNVFLIQATCGDVQTLKLGNLENLGDEIVLARIKGVIPNPEGFLSVMTEVAYAAWHLSKGRVVRPYEDPGHPDSQIEELPLPLPVLADCKRIRSAAGPNRIQQAMKKANNPEPCSDGIPPRHSCVGPVRVPHWLQTLPESTARDFSSLMRAAPTRIDPDRDVERPLQIAPRLCHQSARLTRSPVSVRLIDLEDCGCIRRKHQAWAHEVPQQAQSKLEGVSLSSAPARDW